MKTDAVKSLQAPHKGFPCPSREEGVHRPHEHTDHHNSDQPSASTSTWQACGRGERGIQAYLLKTQGHLRSFPKYKPNNKVDKEILK